MHPFWQLTFTRIRQFIREPSAVFWVYAFPLIMVVALGTAFRNKPVEEIIVDVESGPHAERVNAALRDNTVFRVRVSSAEEASQRLKTGRTTLVIRATDSRREFPVDTTPQYDYVFDPTRPGSLLARNEVDDLLQRAAGRKDVVVTNSIEVVQPGSRYIDFLIPGLIGMGLMGGGMWGVGYATVDMRIRKLLKRFLATPMKRTHFLASMICSRLVFTIPEVLIIILFARWFFEVQVQGSWLVLLVLLLAGAFQFSGIGLLVASRADTLETVSGLMNLVMVPMWIASGIFFSPDRFPESMQPIIQCLPLTPLIGGLRKVMLEGSGFADIGLELLAIVAWGIIPFVAALKIFRWH